MSLLLLSACKPSSPVVSTSTPSTPDAEQPVCEQNADCERGEICVKDSRGARCELPAPQQFACASNTVQTQLTSTNAFDPSVASCADDCAPNQVCNALTCVCESTLCNPPQYIRLSNQPMVQDAKAQYDEVTLQDLENMSSDDRTAFSRQKGDVLISSFEYYLNRNVTSDRYDVPYPRDQFTLEPASPDGVPCANEHFDAKSAVEVDGASLNGPTIDCGWGSPDVFEGLLIICPAQLLDWFDAYKKVNP